MSNKRHLLVNTGTNPILAYSAPVEKHKTDYRFLCDAKDELGLLDNSLFTFVCCIFTTRMDQMYEATKHTPWAKYHMGDRDRGHLVIYPDVKTIHIFNEFDICKQWFEDITKCIYRLNQTGIAYYAEYLDCPNFIDELQERFHILDHYFGDLEKRWLDTDDACDLTQLSTNSILTILGK